jgi:23S rRNA (adenine2030-N6)-methyltransferase
LIVVNPPWRLAEEALLFLPALAQRLAREEFGGFRCDPIGPRNLFVTIDSGRRKRRTS